LGTFLRNIHFGFLYFIVRYKIGFDVDILRYQICFDVHISSLGKGFNVDTLSLKTIGRVFGGISPICDTNISKNLVTLARIKNAPQNLDNNTHRTRATSGINNFSYP
jgi:hypothetical protein